ncbi:glycosyltransferase family 2 protein [Flammeovirga sp. EKP202]|uniref:glycosyltransferase family 2 protein n=1 Tax=Flammeovirga sp. EKP202 TaxID=2770592 RepID=UPI00165F8A27|nr:glycosyltransferase family 2 protein [Flammeovirga sp. EKP202]MBD0401388.1 glycosyltransferase family 2 protein [Flammeovirga sp. EKP202]
MLSIITVNFRQLDVTLELVKSLMKFAPKDSEWIIVDNGSQKDISIILEKLDPRVKVIVSEENLGFAGGNNLGIEASKGDFLFFINNDTVVTKNSFEPLLKSLEDEKVGMVCPKIHYYYTPNTIQYSGFTDINPFTGRNSVIGEREQDQGQYDNIKKTYFGHGAAMMLRRKVVEEVGGIPEAFFLYYEEMDWCKKIRKAGYEIQYNGNAMILHKESISVGKLSPLKEYYMTRNRILFMYRNYPIFYFIGFLLFFMVLSFPKRYVFLLNKDKKLNTALRAGLLSALLYLFNKSMAQPKDGLKYA